MCATASPEPPESLEQLRRDNEALVAENARLRGALEEQELHLASFPLLNPNPVLEVDRAGRTLFCNAAARKVLQSLEVDVAAPGPFLPAGFGGVAAGLREGEGGAGRHEVTLRGRTFLEHLYLPPGTGAVRIYAYEITEQARAQRELAAALQRVERNLAEIAAVNAELEAFVYSVSHDLREPVRAVSAFAQMVRAHQAGRLDDRDDDYLRRIERGAARMSRLIEDLLDLSRISRQRIDRGEVDLSGIAAVRVAELREADPGRGVEVRIEPALTALADHGLIEIVLSNLLSNAWKFTGKVGTARIRFGATSRAGERVFAVEDNGVGFDPVYASQMFQPFHRLHAEREYPGTGIGLAMVERIVNRHGGRVWAEGRPGAGATFFFTLGDGNQSGAER